MSRNVNKNWTFRKKLITLVFNVEKSKIEVTKMSKLNFWTHPKNGQERIYLNLGQQAKIWVEKSDIDPLGQDYTIKTFAKDLFEFRNSFTIPKNNIFESKLAIFISSLGLSDGATGKDVLNIAPNFNALRKMCNQNINS